MGASCRVLLAGPLVAALALAPDRAAGQAIVGFAVEPPEPTTGDPVALVATVSFPEDCAWSASASAAFGPQAELGGGRGWGIDLELEGAAPACAPGALQIEFREILGTLPVASGAGVLRLRVGDAVVDTAPFSLSVAAGPAPGWNAPVLHDGFTLFILGASLAAVGDLLAIGDNAAREIVLFDPRSRVEILSFQSPGSGNVRALAYDGAHLYASVLDSAGPRLYKLDLAGNRLDVFPSPTVFPAAFPLEGLAFRQGILYGSLPSPTRLYAINPLTHAILWQRGLPARILGLDAGPAGLIGVEPTGLFYDIEPAPDGVDRLIADTADTGLTGPVELTGLAWDGSGLFLLDSGFSDLKIVRTYALWWAMDGTLRAYAPEAASTVDVVRGDLSRLRLSSGSVDLGPTVCVMSGGAGGVVPDGGDPPVGKGFFYMARYRRVDGFTISYGRADLGQFAPITLRRIDSGESCP